MFNPEFLTSDSEAISSNSLIQYLQDQSPDVLQRVARSASGDIQDIIRHNVQGLLGMLPGEHFKDAASRASSRAATTDLQTRLSRAVRPAPPPS